MKTDVLSFKTFQKQILLYVLLILSSWSYSQTTSINYKAIIKDDSGNPIINESIAIRFTILEGVILAPKYQETHTPTTSANGLVILNIGEGTVDSGIYNTIDWGSDDHFLNVQVSIGEGLVDLGTTQFHAVPYALNAANVTGLEALNEGNGEGWRLKGFDPGRYGNIGSNAVDLSYSDVVTSISKGARGTNSVAMGRSTTAVGTRSTAMGNLSLASANSSTAMGSTTTASGVVATAMGSGTIASGWYATSMGENTVASGYNSTAMGFKTKAEALASTVLGRFNIGGGSPNGLIIDDPVFEIGIGTSDSNRLNALTTLRNGNVGIGTHQPNTFLEIAAENSATEPNLLLTHIGNSGARINFSNTDTTNGNVWTLYGDTNDITSNSTFNLFHSTIGNVLTAKGNGNIGIGGTPNSDLHIFHDNNISSGGLKIQNSGANNNFWRMYTNNVSGNLFLYSSILGSISAGNFDNVSGAYSSTSDRRLKKDFQPLPFSWERFMNLKTLSYLYKTQTNNERSLGLIAQDVELIYPELVSYNKKDDVYHLNYSGFGVVAIKATQELKAEVELLKDENKILKKQLSMLETLEARLLALESKVGFSAAKTSEMSDKK